jgi:predicted  nucleic acid-binding Zn-ribbon protein
MPIGYTIEINAAQAPPIPLNRLTISGIAVILIFLAEIKPSIAPMVKAIQELKAENDLLNEEFKQQQTKIEALESRLLKLESLLVTNKNK